MGNKKGFRKVKCKICGKIKSLQKRRVTCSSKCSHKYRNSSKRVLEYYKKK